jgi:hypothetical protein
VEKEGQTYKDKPNVEGLEPEDSNSTKSGKTTLSDLYC